MSKRATPQRPYAPPVIQPYQRYLFRRFLDANAKGMKLTFRSSGGRRFLVEVPK